MSERGYLGITEPTYEIIPTPESWQLGFGYIYEPSEDPEAEPVRITSPGLKTYIEAIGSPGGPVTKIPAGVELRNGQTLQVPEVIIPIPWDKIPDFDLIRHMKADLDLAFQAMGTSWVEKYLSAQEARMKLPIQTEEI